MNLIIWVIIPSLKVIHFLWQKYGHSYAWKSYRARSHISLDQKVGDFYDEFSQGIASKLTVGDLASMSSGLDWTENITPL